MEKIKTSAFSIEFIPTNVKDSKSNRFKEREIFSGIFTSKEEAEIKGKACIDDFVKKKLAIEGLESRQTDLGANVTSLLTKEKGKRKKEYLLGYYLTPEFGKYNLYVAYRTKK